MLNNNTIRKIAKVLFISLMLFLMACDNTNLDIERFKAFGTQRFDQKRWVHAGPVDRGKMIYAFLKEREPIADLPTSEIRKLLGESTAKYKFASFPAYYIGKQPAGSDEPAYIIAFSLNHSTGKIISLELIPEDDE